ncbi:phage integrase N-terminal SAM-like domain-containing protein [Catenovulum sediminis]|uniref:Phage integrase N-terminal SAM-like domain-containing protein n=1 Tax=Catenovulum sediminis TaxID=1740262 RepID=A0ABV1RIP2_9ALTE|nr:phage integrase N-terminal SAM-like domain-containing protein [Catenovulum sediminis]
MNSHDQTQFNTLYLTYINELKLQGKSDKTIECYSRALRQTADFFDTCPDDLSVEDLKRFNKVTHLVVIVTCPCCHYEITGEKKLT